MLAFPVLRRQFIGRVDELEVLHACRRDLAQRRGRVALVRGPAGIGKSRLISEFCNSITGGRAPILVRTECLEFGGLTFGPVRELVMKLVASGKTELDAAAQDALDRADFFRSLERIVREASQKRAIVIVVEDLHWADPATLDFFAYLGPRISTERMLIVATYRDDEVDARPELARTLVSFVRGSNARQIALKPLPDRDIRSLMDASTVPGVPPPADVIADIVRRAEGNPLFAEELLKSVLEGVPHHRLPQSIKTMVRARLALLDPDDRDVLRHAAILGVRFDPELLSAIAPQATGKIARALARGCEHRLLIEEDRSEDDRGDLRFRFSHALTHQAIAEETLAFEARPLHARIAKLLESAPAAEARIDEIAYHWWKANVSDAALRTNEASGERAMTLHAYGEAYLLFERGLCFARDRGDCKRLSARAALAATLDGAHATALKLYERTIELDIEAGDFGSAAEQVRRIAGRLANVARDAEARDRLAAFARDYGQQLSAGQLLLVEGWPMLIDMGGGSAQAWLAKLSRQRERVVLDGHDAWALRFLEVNARAALGEVAAWLGAVARIRPYTESGTVGDQAMTLLMIAVTAAHLGHDAAFARAALDELFAFCERHRLAAIGNAAWVAEAFHRYLHGDAGGAKDAIEHALPDWDDRNQRMNVAIVGILAGLDLSDAGLLRLGADAALLWELAQNTFGHSRALAAAGVARAALQMGRDEDAIALLERAVSNLETTFGTQFLLPLAARHVRSAAARRRIEQLLDGVMPGDASGTATAAMVRAVFAYRDRSPDRAALADEAYRLYAALGWPSLAAAAERLGSRDNRAAGPDAHAAAPSDILSARERDVVNGVVEGLGNAAIAARLGVSVKTVESHLSRVYSRFGLRSRTQLAAFMSGSRAI